MHRIDRLVVTGQHTDCCCRHTSYDAFIRGIEVVAVADATAVYQPFAAAGDKQVQNGALQYLRTYYGADPLTPPRSCSHIDQLRDVGESGRSLTAPPRANSASTLAGVPAPHPNRPTASDDVAPVSGLIGVPRHPVAQPAAAGMPDMITDPATNSSEARRRTARGSGPRRSSQG